MRVFSPRLEQSSVRWQDEDGYFNETQVDLKILQRRSVEDIKTHYNTRLILHISPSPSFTTSSNLASLYASSTSPRLQLGRASYVGDRKL